MQLGFLRLNSPPDCLTYFPSFCVGKKYFELCGARPRALPLDSASFLEENLTKDFIRPLTFRTIQNN